jgi:ribosomal protein S13
MSINTPIFSIAKDLNIESNRILLACKKLGINAKGAAKRLNKEELEKIKSYFKTGKNVSDEIVNLNKNKVKSKSSSRKIEDKVKINYFANRLIRKS